MEKASHSSTRSARDEFPHQGRSFRVVVADDDRDTVLTLVTLLRAEGYETKGVYDGKEVVKAVHDFSADAALIDIAMPGATGYEVAREIRKRFGADAPVLIAVTAWKKHADQVLAQLAGFDYHIGKPYDPNGLLAILGNALVKNGDSGSRPSNSPNRSA